jgi:FdhE protein
MEAELAVVRALAREITRLAGDMRPAINRETALARVHAGVPALAGEPLLGGQDLRTNAFALGAVPEIGPAIYAVAAALSPLCNDELAQIALTGEWDAIGRLAAEIDVDEPALLTVLDYAARPALVAGTVSLGDIVDQDVPSRSTHCPMCGAPPLIAELSGKDGARSLRCGRCGGRWRFPRLACATCGAEHTGALHGEGDAGIRQADYCDHCHGYLKAVSVLAPLDYVALLETDLRTAGLDLAAIDRGYARVPTRGPASL